MCTDTCTDMSTYMCTYMCTDMGTDMCRDMCTDMCTDMYTGMCTDMCTDMCTEKCMNMCTDMCTDMCVDMCVARAINRQDVANAVSAAADMVVSDDELDTMLSLFGDADASLSLQSFARLLQSGMLTPLHAGTGHHYLLPTLLGTHTASCPR